MISQLALKRLARLNGEELIKKMKKEVKDEDSFLEMCKKYNVSPDFVDSVHISFEPLDVSAKTVNGKIFLNEKLLDQDFDDAMRYFQHELTHVCQQAAGEVDGKTPKADYLDDPNEQEAFQYQLDYMEEHTPEEVDDYLDKLLDHHNIKGKEREEKKDVLLNG